MITISGLVIFGFLGLMIGSLINAVVWRIKVGRSIVNDRSECPHCHHKLGVVDLIPVLNWLYLGGRCRYCHKPISVQYPLVELLTAGLFLLSYLRLAHIGWQSWLNFVGWLYILTSLIIVSLYDLKWLILPDVVVLPAISVAFIPVVTNVLTHAPTRVWLGPILAGLGLAAGFYSLAAVSKGRWMGGGDIKLVGLIGLVLGLKLSFVAMLLAFNLAAIVSLGLILARVKTRKDHIAFGPFLALGCILALLFGQQLISWYQQLFIR